MRDGDKVMFALRALFRKVSLKCGIPHTDILSGVEQSISKVAWTSFLHVSIRWGQLSGLVSGWGHSCVSKDFIRGRKPAQITNLCKNHCSHTVVNTGNSKNWSIQVVHNLFDGRFIPDESIIQMVRASTLSVLVCLRLRLLRNRFVCNGLIREMGDPWAIRYPSMLYE